MYPSLMQQITADQVINDLDDITLSKLWDERDRSNQFYNKPDTPIIHNGVMLIQEHVKNELVKNRGLKFLTFYADTTQEKESVKALSEASTEFLTELWDNWDGCELIEINGIGIHEAHLHVELTENRGISRCLC